MKIILTKKEILTPLRKLTNDELIEKLYNCLQKHNIQDKELEKLIDEIDERLLDFTNKIDELEEEIENLKENEYYQDDYDRYGVSRSDFQ